ncbi:MAG: DUF6273 domain-containing protein [Defluviitaleaceae bacterium]|nr:DUF6273 domain-containing protein [Defluviitaleaceae bacterium]
MKCTSCEAPLVSPKGVALTVCPFCHTDNSVKKQTAKSEGEAALREEFLKRGEKLYQDKQVLRAVIGDYFATDKKMLKGLRLAVDDGIAIKIAELLSHSVSEQKMRLSAIVSYFADDYLMDKSHVAAVIRVLAFGAGISDEVLEGITQGADDNGKQITKPLTSLPTAPIAVNPQVIHHQPQTQLPRIGDNYYFGGYNWRILDMKGNKVLLLSEDILEQREYHLHLNGSVDIIWRHCTLRQYLNGEFLNKFSQSDKNRISRGWIANPDNLWYGTKGGCDTTDKVFILSLEEVDRYLGDSGDYVNKRRKEYSGKWIEHDKGAILQNNYDKDRVVMYNGSACWWWLRSPGNLSTRAAYVTDDGYVYVDGLYVSAESGGVRPALWLNL